MAKHTIYIPDHVEPLLLALLDLQQAEHPGTQPRCSHVVSDALVAHAAQLSLKHIKANGLTPRIRARLDELAKAVADHA